MPAYNEEKNLAAAVSDAKTILAGARTPFEIIIVNDGSTDRTGTVARDLSQGNRRIRMIDRAVNRGLGSGMKLGIQAARMPYVTLYPSDNEMDKHSFRQLLAARKRADLVMAYMANPLARSAVRRVVSAVFVGFLNTLFGLSLRYYTGPFIARTRLLREAHLVSDGVTILAELRVKLITRAAARFIEIPFTFRMRKHGRATLFRWKTFAQTAETLIELLRH